MESYYGGVAQRMAERLEVSKTWLSRFLDLAKLPRDVVDAFGDVLQLRENHARELKPLLASDPARSRVMAAAKKLARQQAILKDQDKPLMEAAKVVASLKQAGAGEGTRAGPQAPVMVVNDKAVELFSLKVKGRRVVLDLSLDAQAPNADFLTAFERELGRLRPAG